MASGEALTLAFIERRPEAAARALHEVMPQQAADLLAEIASAIAAPALACMAPPVAARCLTLMEPGRAGQILAAMHDPVAGSLLRLIAGTQAAEILEWLPLHRLRGVRGALECAPETVRAWTDSAVPAFLAHNTAAAARQWLATQSDSALSHLYVVDADQRLLGGVSVTALTSAANDTTLGECLDRGIHPVPDAARLVDVAASPAWDAALALPVADKSGRVVGVLTRAALRRGLQRRRALGEMRGDASLFANLVDAFAHCAGGIMQVLAPRRGAGGQRERA